MLLSAIHWLLGDWVEQDQTVQKVQFDLGITLFDKKIFPRNMYDFEISKVEILFSSSRLKLKEFKNK